MSQIRVFPNNLFYLIKLMNVNAINSEKLELVRLLFIYY